MRVLQTWLVVGSALLVCVPTLAESDDPAAHELSGIVAVLTGQSSLTVTRDADGNVVWIYGPSAPALSSERDPSIADDPARLHNALVQARRDIQAGVWRSFLLTAADVDSSGDTSVAEARALRHQIELAFFVHHLSRVPTVPELAETLRRDRSSVVGDLAAYQRLFDHATREGLEGLPELPEEMRGAA